MQSHLLQCQQWVTDSALSNNTSFDGVVIDSRAVKPGNLFVALHGERFDAHAFLRDVQAAGAAAAVINKNCPDAYLTGVTIPLLRVPDTKAALAQMGTGWRQQFTALPVIGVTGSNGKTTVKEMIAAILRVRLGEDGMLSTRGNLNNEIGVPLTVFRLSGGTRGAVIELGMNHPGEIAILTQIAQPTVGIVNNAQREHQEFMETVEAVAIENGAVIRGLPADGVAVFPAEDTYSALWQGYAGAMPGRRTITFGLTPAADVHATYLAKDFSLVLQGRALGAPFTVTLAAAGEHNVKNALAAMAATLAIGTPLTVILRGLESFAPVSGRMQKKHATNGALVIDDTYNANPDSVRAAVDVLATIETTGAKFLILGDMGEVGEDGPAFHTEIGKYASEKGVDIVLTIGELAHYTCNAFGIGAIHYATKDDLYASLTTLITPSAIVLVKGSRFMKMEGVVSHLVDVKS